jgi:hypothetical protein
MNGARRGLSTGRLVWVVGFLVFTLTLAKGQTHEIALAAPDSKPAMHEAAPATADSNPAMRDVAPATPDSKPAMLEVAPATPDSKPATKEARAKAVEEFDGRTLPPDRQWPASAAVLRRRPSGPDEHRADVVVENLLIHHLTNLRGVEVLLAGRDAKTRQAVVLKSATVRNVEIHSVAADERAQKVEVPLSAIRIYGGGQFQPDPTDVLLEDVRIHDVDAVPILIERAKYGTITLRRVKVTGSAVQIAATEGGSVKRIVIEDSPGLSVELIGPPGSIQQYTLRKSPGAKVEDTETFKGRSGARKVDEDTATEPVDPPVAGGQGEPKLNISGDIEHGQIHVELEGTLPPTVGFVVFEVFDKDEYRVATPVTVMNAPWKADMKIRQPGTHRLQANLRTTSGDPLPPITMTVKVEMPMK